MFAPGELPRAKRATETMPPRLSHLVVLVAGLGWLGPVMLLSAGEPPRYTAVLTDDTRVEGQQITGWASAGDKPKLDSVELFNAQRTLRWLRDRTLPAFDPGIETPGFVEMVSGDRLPGKVVGFEEGRHGEQQEPAHLVVTTDFTRPPMSFRRENRPPPTAARVLPRAVRRVVWGKGLGRALEPGTLFFADGRRLAFRGLRWSSDAVKVLVDDGVRRFSLTEIAEVHLPRTDPWRSYREELAVIAPDGATRLVRLETTRGLIVTAPEPGVRPVSAGGDQNRSYHVVQPAWSLDRIWVPFNTVRTRWHFAPHEVPLSRCLPARFVERPLLGKGWSWHADSNAEGGLLENARGPHGWGLGVHAPSELWFDLPEGVLAFRTRVGLDRLAGDGGCARAAVYLNAPQGTPLYQSKHLVGSQETVDTGRLPLPSTAKSLVLVADAAERDRPAGSDPLDIRDALDWIEPVLMLDPEKLKADVRQAIAPTVSAWEGWAVAVEGGSLEASTTFPPGEFQLFRAHRGIGTGGRPLTLSIEREISDSQSWLWVRVVQADDDFKRGRFEVRADGQPIARFDVPVKPTSFYVPLERYLGKTIKLQLMYQPGEPKEQIDWQALTLTDGMGQTRWTTLAPVEARSLAGSVLAAQSDAAVLASGLVPDNDAYVVTVRTEMPEINALRLEALLDDSLPRDGPGRSPIGKFVLTRLSVATAPQEVPPVRARYLRIEAIRPAKSPLALAEVQVMAGRDNLAPRGKATQSSTEGQSVPERAIDGNIDGSFTAKSFSQTKFADPHPWWELDLGGMKAPDRIVLWYPSDRSLFPQYRNFQATLLDEGRKAVWQRLLDDPPGPCDELLLADVVDVPLDLLEPIPRVRGKLPEKRLTAWQAPWTCMKGGSPASALYAPAQPIDPRGKVLVLTLRHFAKDPGQLLGRFRISATAEKPPFALEPNGVEVPLLSER
jgi:hypothetical protein